MAVWTERSNTDKASLTKMKMTLSCGRSDEYDMFLHLRGRKRDNWRLLIRTSQEHQGSFMKQNKKRYD